MKRNLIYIAALALVGLVLLVVYLSQSGTIIVTVGEGSEIKKGVVISFSIDKFKDTYSAPGRIEMRPGSYQYAAFANGSNITTGQVIVKNGQEVKINILVNKNPDASLPGSNPDTLSGIKHFNLFPYRTEDYILEAVPNNDLSSIKELRLTVFHHFSTELNRAETDLALTGAKNWLKSQGLDGLYEIKATN
jgi:hypothetical protein